MLKDGSLYVIDFQDARLGPCSYDLVSLCFDSYVPLSLESRLGLVADALTMVGKTLHPRVAKQLRESWRPMLLQRQLKALGSFAYLTRLGRQNYLKYIPEATAILSELDLFDSRWPFLSKEFLQSIHEAVS